jgi:alkylation response protein AidB-like acyl-CoA dehydrogenase
LERFDRAEDLEQFLGDPVDPSTTLSFKRAVELDESEEYPYHVLRSLQQWGLTDYFVPTESGGKLGSFDEAAALLKVISRRDLTVALLTLDDYAGAAPIWITGTHRQKLKAAEMISSGSHISPAYFEEAGPFHDGTRAQITQKGYVLNGEKSLINNARRSDALTVSARTDDRNETQDFRIFFIEYADLNGSGYSLLDRARTTGIRGADIGGIDFVDCLIPHKALVGDRDQGLDLALKARLMTWALSAALSVGAADTALRITLSFALSRNLYGNTVFTIPHARGILVDAFVDQLICDCVSVSAARALHAGTEHVVNWSLAVNYFVAPAVEASIRNLSVLLGSRYYLREEYYCGIFQKILRDIAVVNSLQRVPLNLGPMVSHLRNLKVVQESGASKSGLDHITLLEPIFSLSSPLPPFDPRRLGLSNGDQFDLARTLESAPDLFTKRLAGDAAHREAIEAAKALTLGLIEEMNKERDLVAELKAGVEPDESPLALELVRRHSVLSSAAACIYLWAFNRDTSDAFFQRGEWLALCLQRLQREFRPDSGSAPVSFSDAAASELATRHAQRRMFSIVPIQLA